MKNKNEGDGNITQLVDTILDGLKRCERWHGGSIVVDEDGNYDAVPLAYLSDISYTGSKVEVLRIDNIEDILGDPWNENGEKIDDVLESPSIRNYIVESVVPDVIEQEMIERERCLKDA